MDHDSEVILQLTCATCDNPDCKIAPKYIPADSLIGCTRWVPEEIYEQYVHYMEEIIPFWHLYKLDFVNKSYFEIYNFLQDIYKKYPIVGKVDKKGKVIGG